MNKEQQEAELPSLLGFTSNSEILAIRPQDLAPALASLSAYHNGTMKAQDVFANCAASYGMDFAGDSRKRFPFANGVALIPISGILMHRVAVSWGWVTGYTAIRNMLIAAEADPDVRGIAYDIHSGGGDALGMFELADDIRKSSKPSIAIVDGAAYSAAYGLASAAKRISVLPTGGVGSIGVKTMHVDLSEYYKKMGIKIEELFSGDHKIDGSPYKDLSPKVRDAIQSRLDSMRDRFAGVVADYRGKEKSEILATEAQTYSAEEALKIGLVDEIATPREALSSFMAELRGSKLSGGTKMSGQTGGQTTAPQTDTNAAAGTANVADLNAAKSEGAKSERQRVGAILGCEEAKGREKLANHIAFNTSMNLEDARAMLSASAVEVAATKVDDSKASTANAFSAAMTTQVADLGVGADTNFDNSKKNTGLLLATEWAAATGHQLVNVPQRTN